VVVRQVEPRAATGVVTPGMFCSHWRFVRGLAAPGAALILIFASGCGTVQPSGRLPASAQEPGRRPEGRLAIACHLEATAASDICTLNADGSDLRRLTSGPRNEYDADWSPDGRQLVFRSAPSADPASSGPSDIVVVDVETKLLRNLTNHPEWGNWSPAWSPDGKWIAFYSDRDQQPGLYLIRPDGTDMHLLLEGDAEYPSWSPDGDALVFMSLGFPPGSSSSAFDVWLVNADGTNLRRLTESDGEDGWPAYSADGKQIAYTHDRGSTIGYEIVVVDRTGGNPVVVTPDNDGLSHDYPAWSRDGRYLAWSGYAQSGPDRGGVFVMNLANNTQQAIASDGVGPAWQPSSAKRDATPSS